MAKTRFNTTIKLNDYSLGMNTVTVIIAALIDTLIITILHKVIILE